jgi:hypothetical protein
VYPTQIDALIRCAAPHLRPLLIFLAGTGVRPSEAFELEWSNVDLRGARGPSYSKNRGRSAMSPHPGGFGRPPPPKWLRVYGAGDTQQGRDPD